MRCEVHELESLQSYRYVVVFARYGDAWVFCRHKQRRTWETAGGHIEAGESPLEAARRELYEETGALTFEIEPVCDYWAADDASPTGEGSEANGMVFYADVATLGPLPETEMARVGFFQHLPGELTYPDITPKLFAHLATAWDEFKARVPAAGVPGQEQA